MKVQVSPTSASPSSPSEQFISPLSGTPSGRQAINYTHWITMSNSWLCVFALYRYVTYHYSTNNENVYYCSVQKQSFTEIIIKII